LDFFDEGIRSANTSLLKLMEVTMRKLMVLLVFCCAGKCFAQPQDQTIDAVVGDTTIFSLSSSLPGECEATFEVTDYGSSDPSILGVYQNSVRFIPPKNGMWYDTVTFHWHPTAGFQNEGCTDIYRTVDIIAEGYNDSTAKLRPRYLYIPMYEKQALGQWDAYFAITLDNNIASATTFKNFRLKYNLPPGLQAEILDGTQIITSYSSKQFERRKQLSVHLWLPGAPLADSVFFQGEFAVDVVSNSTTEELRSDLYITIHPFVGSGVEVDKHSEPIALYIFPNPIKGLFQISFTLPQQNQCILRIVNLLGEEMKTIYKGIRSEGLQNISFDASAIPSGEYFCELQTGIRMIREKIIIEK
jgi:hypothetical protein